MAPDCAIRHTTAGHDAPRVAQGGPGWPRVAQGGPGWPRARRSPVSSPYLFERVHLTLLDEQHEELEVSVDSARVELRSVVSFARVVGGGRRTRA